MSETDATTQAAILELVLQAGRGDKAEDWLHKGILAAGYVRKEDRFTKAEFQASLRRLMDAVESAGLVCAETCGEQILDRIISALQRLSEAVPE